MAMVILMLVPLSSAAQESGGDEVKAMSGMSVLGNNEAPKSLVIVPWKSSELGDGIGVSNVLDDRARPVDKEVFLRELSYYSIRTSGDAGADAGSLEGRDMVGRQWREQK
jgi:hypothetical protein